MRRDVFSADPLVGVAGSESAQPSPKKGEGAVCIQWVRCGKRTCRCMRDGPKHGPYFRRFWWQDGRRCRRYVRKEEAVDFAAACAIRREAERAERERNDATRQAWREVRTLIREVERGER